MGYRELMRRKLLEEIYDDLSEVEKRMFVQLTMQDKGYRDIMQALHEQHRQLDAIKKKQNLVTDFISDISANFLTDGLIWIGSKFFKKL